jgi:hypothetical protein
MLCRFFGSWIFFPLCSIKISLLVPVTVSGPAWPDSPYSYNHPTRKACKIANNDDLFFSDKPCGTGWTNRLFLIKFASAIIQMPSCCSCLQLVGGREGEGDCCMFLL